MGHRWKELQTPDDPLFSQRDLIPLQYRSETLLEPLSQVYTTPRASYKQSRSCVQSHVDNSSADDQAGVHTSRDPPVATAFSSNSSIRSVATKMAVYEVPIPSEDRPLLPWARRAARRHGTALSLLKNRQAYLSDACRQLTGSKPSHEP